MNKAEAFYRLLYLYPLYIVHKVLGAPLACIHSTFVDIDCTILSVLAPQDKQEHSATGMARYILLEEHQICCQLARQNLLPC